MEISDLMKMGQSMRGRTANSDCYRDPNLVKRALSDDSPKGPPIIESEINLCKVCEGFKGYSASGKIKCDSRCDYPDD